MSKKLDELRVGDEVWSEWPGRPMTAHIVMRVTPTLIVAGGKRWNRKNGMPVPMRMFQGQRLVMPRST